MDGLDKCYLCGGKSTIIGSCVAGDNNDSVDWLLGKLPKGKTRTVYFCLCEECFNLPNKEELIVKRIDSDLERRTGYAVKVKK